MKDSEQRDNLGNKGVEGHEPIRKSVVVGILVLAVALIGGVVLFLQRTQPKSELTQETEVVTNPGSEETPVLIGSNPNPDPKRTSPLEVKAPVITPAAAETARPLVPVKSMRAEASPYTRQLVKSLTDFDPKQGPITPEKAAEWKQNLEKLMQQGTAAVAAVQEFMDRNEDLRFDAGGGTNILGEKSLRLAFMKALQSIGGPEALAAQSQLIQTTADPQEIALLARQLDQQAPDQYRQVALDAARVALEMAAAGKLPGRDVGPLFGVLQEFGDANVVPDLEKTMGSWRYYGAIAMANLPNDAGVPALLQLSQQPGPKGSFAMELLAQKAADSEAARTALFEKARAGAIPNTAWIEIGSILAGNTVQIGNPAGDGVAPVSGERRWHLGQGDQNFYSIPSTANWSPDQINQRVTMIDQLLAGNTDAIAIDSLQKAKAALQAKLPQPTPGQ